MNDTVGELFPDLEIRQSLLRYVREGGGIGGWHGSGWASRSWPELVDMMGAADGPHRVEPGFMRLDDPKSPINQAFEKASAEHRSGDSRNCPCRDRQQALPQQHSPKPDRRSAESHAYTHFVGPLNNGVGNDAVDPDQRE